MELVRSRDRWQHVIWKEHRVLHPVRDAKPEPWILTILLVELASSDSLSKYQDLGWPILQGLILVSSLLWIWPSAIKCFSFWPPNEWAGPVTVDNSPEEPRTDFCRWKLRAALKTLKDILAKTEILSLSFHRFPQPLLGCRSWCTSGVVFWRNWAMVSWVAQSHSWDSDGHTVCCSWLSTKLRWEVQEAQQTLPDLGSVCAGTALFRFPLCCSLSSNSEGLGVQGRRKNKQRNEKRLKKESKIFLKLCNISSQCRICRAQPSVSCLWEDGSLMLNN